MSILEQLFSYNSDPDPVLEDLRHMITASGLSSTQIADAILKLSHVYKPSTTTIDNYCNGKTKRPQNFIVTWIGAALGYHRQWTRL